MARSPIREQVNAYHVPLDAWTRYDGALTPSPGASWHANGPPAVSRGSNAPACKQAVNLT